MTSIEASAEFEAEHPQGTEHFSTELSQSYSGLGDIFKRCDGRAGVRLALTAGSSPEGDASSVQAPLSRHLVRHAQGQRLRRAQRRVEHRVRVVPLAPPRSRVAARADGLVEGQALERRRAGLGTEQKPRLSRRLAESDCKAMISLPAAPVRASTMRTAIRIRACLAHGTTGAVCVPMMSSVPLSVDASDSEAIGKRSQY